LQRKSETIQALIQAGRSATADTDNDSVLDEFVLYAVKMRQLSSRLLQAQDDEPRSIAQNLRDLTGENLTALLMSLRRLRGLTPERDQRRRVLLRDCFSLVEKTADEIRTLSYVLHPPLLDEAGLAAAVPWYTTGFAERSGTRVNLDMAEDFGRLPPNVEITLFRTLQECLQNIRHSRCSVAKICLACSASRVLLEVADNGRGMPEHLGRHAINEKPPMGVGITGMRERVEKLNGQLEIESAAGKGTTVRVTLPTGVGPGALERGKLPPESGCGRPRAPPRLDEICIWEPPLPPLNSETNPPGRHANPIKSRSNTTGGTAYAFCSSLHPEQVRMPIPRIWLWRGMRITIAVAMVYCAYLALRQGVGAYQARKSTPAALEKAIRWDPGNPEDYDALATLTHQYSDRENPAEVVRLARAAVGASPMQADYWADLGSAYEWAGQREGALRCFERARDLFPMSPDINWRLANFYVRDGKTGPAEVALQRALLGNPELRRPAFALGWGATSDNQELLAHMIPEQADVLLSYLNYLIATKRIEAANQTWAHLLDLHLSFGVRDAFPYLDALIVANEPERLEQAWAAMVERFPAQLHPRVAYPNRIVNGGFEFEILNGGLDWRVLPTPGATVRVDSLNFFDGVHSLRIQFDGKHNLDYGSVMQYVPVHPQTLYRFSGYIRVEGITTDSGPRFQIYDAEAPSKLLLSTENLTGSSTWSPERLEFTTGPETRLLVVRLVRAFSHKFDNLIAGTVWIDQISLNSAE